MRIHCISVSGKTSDWIQTGIDDYLKRFPKEIKWDFTNLSPVKRSKNGAISTLIEKESEYLFSHVRPEQFTIALDEKGQLWNTDQMALHLKKWLQQGQSINLLIGGADGFSPVYLKKASLIWSLSPLTFPHQLVRLLIVEQFYRSWSILNHHPYHRGTLA